MRTVTLYRLSGLAVMIGMTIDGFASFLYSRAGGVALYLDPLVPINDLAKLLGSLIFLIGLPGLYAFQATRAGRLGLAGFVLSFFGLAILEVSTEAMFAFVGPVLAAHDETRFLLQGGLEQNLGGGFLAYFTLSYLVIMAGFVSFGFATFRARVYPRWAGPVIVIGSVAAIVMAPLVSVPSGPFRLDRVGVVARASAKSRDARFVRLAGTEPLPPTCDFRRESGSMGCLRHVAFPTKRDFDGALGWWPPRSRLCGVGGICCATQRFQV